MEFSDSVGAYRLRNHMCAINFEHQGFIYWALGCRGESPETLNLPPAKQFMKAVCTSFLTAISLKVVSTYKVGVVIKGVLPPPPNKNPR